MSTDKYLKEFSLTLVDVIFGVLLGTLFSKYELLNSSVGIFLFFFTSVIIINYWYSYRKWFANVMSIDYKTKVYDVAADLGILFVGYQLASNFYKGDIILFYTWFIGIFIMDSIWVIERLIVQSDIIENKRYHYYWLITDIITVIVLIIVGYLARREAFFDTFYCVTMLIIYSLTFALDRLVEKKIK